MRLLELQLGGVLDRDDALAIRDERRQDVEVRRLAGARAAGVEVLSRARTARFITVTRSSVYVPKLMRSFAVYGSGREFPMVSTSRGFASGGNDGVAREPSGRRASTMGEAASTRRPTADTILSITWR